MGMGAGAFSFFSQGKVMWELVSLILGSISTAESGVGVKQLANEWVGTHEDSSLKYSAWQVFVCQVLVGYEKIEFTTARPTVTVTCEKLCKSLCYIYKAK